AIAFYIVKIFLPLRLGIDYGRAPNVALQHGWPYFTWILPVAIAVMLWLMRKRWRAAATAALVFAMALAPMLGLAMFDFQRYSTVADHYLYLPMLGAAIVVASLARGRISFTLWAILIVLVG